MPKLRYMGMEFCGTPREIVEKLKNSNMFTSGETVEEYMRNVSRRFKTVDNTRVRPEPVEAFLSDLEASGAVLIEYEND